MDIEILANIRCYLIDMDGTFYLGEKLLPGALEFIDLLRSRGVTFYFLTNNSSQHRSGYAKKLRQLGLEIEDDQVITSGEATALHVIQEWPGAEVYLVGTTALEEEFDRHGIRIVDDAPQVAVLGFDTTLTYSKLWRLCNFVREGVPYVATHPDVNCPTEDGFMPDIGAMIAFVQASTGRVPDVIVGKPHRPIVEVLSLKTGLEVHQMCMVGDYLKTDIAMGSHGITTVLVLSGETTEDDLSSSPNQPDLVVEDLGELTRILGNIS
ncbi:MAG: HAD-IIA family hydrolase [Anaerolineales bacterium]|nr:HAD-IIA family hydrolase [Anaerolineales bacterium]